MKRLQVREFRESFSRLEEPTEVYARAERKGIWFPEGTENVLRVPGGASKEIEALNEEVRFLKGQLAARSEQPSLAGLADQDREYIQRRLEGKKQRR